MRAPQFGPSGSGKLNVAVQRPTVNLKEAENLGEEANASAVRPPSGVRFSKHGTFGPPVDHAVEKLFD